MMLRLRWTAFQIAAVFALALTLTTYAVLALVYWQFSIANAALVRSILENEVKQTIDMPTDRLKRRLELRLTQDLRRLDYVGLYNERGELVFGNVAQDVVIPADGRVYRISANLPGPATDQRQEAIFVAAVRPAGGRLVLGRSLVYVDELQHEMLRGFAVAILPVVFIALLIGTLVSLRTSRRLGTIQRAIDRVMGGELDVRLPARGTPDDIDALVRAVNEMLDEIVRLIGQIKSVGDNIAHDLRSPLAVMRARLERGLGGRSAAALRTAVSEALDDLDKAMTTVTALLRISELEAHLRRGAFGAINLVAICRDAFDLYEALGESKDIGMSFVITDHAIVSGDGDLLREAVANLIENAIKFTQPGGQVTIECGAADALVRVYDTGPGVALEDRDRIFTRFYRAKGAADQPGVGLGLNMAMTIAELHGFTLRLSPQQNRGACFEIVGEVATISAAAQRRSPADLATREPQRIV